MRRIILSLVGFFVMSEFLLGAPASAAPAPVAELSVTCDDASVHTGRLYQTLFSRRADDAGLSYWVGQRRAGVDGEQVAYWMTQSPEYRTTYGRLDDAQFVHKLYLNLLDRPADLGGHAYWLGLVAGYGRHSVASWMTQTEEFASAWPYVRSPMCDKAERLGLTEVQPGIMAGASGTTVTVIADIRLVDLGAVDGGKTFADRIDGDVVVNANWFTNAGPQAPVVVEGVMSGSADTTERGQIILNQPNCDERAGGLHHIWTGEIYRPNDCVLTAVSGVSLIHKGQRADAYPGMNISYGYTNTSRSHSFIGFDATGNEVIIIATLQMNASQLADYAIGLGVTEGIMLDGGGSTQIKTDAGSLWSSRPVPTFAVIDSRFGQ